MISMIQRAESRTRVWLNNTGLQDIDPSVIVRDVSFQGPQLSTVTVQHARYHGAREIRQRVESNSVTVRFEIHEYSTVMRQSIADRIVSWAMSGGILTTDANPGKRLHAVCTTPPTVVSANAWTSLLSVTFTAFDNPFWEDVHPTTLILSGTTDSGQLYGPGSATDPFVEADVKPTDTLTSLSLVAGNTAITLSGISIPSGKTLSLYYDERMTLHIERVDTGASMISKRTAASADDLMITRGVFSTMSFTANASSSVTFKARGLYL